MPRSDAVRGVFSSRPRSWVRLSLIGATCLCVVPQPVSSQSAGNTLELALPDTSRTAAGIAMGVGMLIEGVTITSHTIIPYLGVGHYVQGDWLNGTLYLGSELGLLFLENSLRDRAGAADFGRYPSFANRELFVKSRGLSPSSHAVNLYADLAHHSAFYVRLLDFYSAYKGFHGRTAARNKVRLSDESIPDLMLSPFKPKYLTDPWVIGPAVLASVVSILGERHDRPLSSATSLTMFNSPFAPAEAAFLHGGVDAYRYMLVASGEEMFFRGALQTELTERADPVVAVGVSSLLFGAWHIPNNDVGGALAATAGGLYLGYRYTASGYDLGEVIAIHFWLDFIVSLVEFIQNPGDGRFVYGITWKL